MKTNTKQRILETGVQIMYEKGYNGTGIQEVLQKAKVPKGSFYFYFKSKEDFALQVIDCFFGHFKATVSQFLADNSKTHIQRIQEFFTQFLDPFINEGFKGGCPIGNFTLEMADINEKFRKQLQLVLDGSISIIADHLKLAQEKGEIQNMDNPRSLAEFIFFSWEGTVMQMKVSQNSKALNQFNHFIFNQLLKQ